MIRSAATLRMTTLRALPAVGAAHDFATEQLDDLVVR